MRSARAALVAATFVLCAPGGAQGRAPLTLEEAFERVLKTHPQLVRLQYEREAASAEIDTARLRPPLSVETQLENAAGSGATSGLERAEITLSLASVLERGGKRDARIALAQNRFEALNTTEEARRLDLLAEVARRYLDVAAAQALEEIAAADLVQRERSVAAAEQRVRAGASPDSIRLSAIAAAARAKLQRTHAQADRQAAIQRLAILWRERQPQFAHVAANLLALPAVPTREALLALLDRNPDLRRFADEKRLREARLELARGTQSADLEWRIGVRRLEDTGDWAAVAGLSVPLGSRSRAASSLRSAQAELAALDLERETEELTLYATLSEAYARLSTANTDVVLARDEVLPVLAQATGIAERAYRAGALSYLEWAQVQTEHITALREQLAAAVQFRRALIEIQRLTNDPFLVQHAAPSLSQAQP